MLAARVFLPASRFNARMSRLVHARLFIDLLHGLKGLKKNELSAVSENLTLMENVKSHRRCRR